VEDLVRWDHVGVSYGDNGLEERLKGYNGWCHLAAIVVRVHS
jgi:hypothetical protein